MNDLQTLTLGGLMVLSLILQLVQIRSLGRIRARLRQRAVNGPRPTATVAELAE